MMWKNVDFCFVSVDGSGFGMNKFKGGITDRLRSDPAGSRSTRRTLKI
jgi:hypothetical protein